MQFGKALLIVILLTLFYTNYSNSKDNQQLEQWFELCPNSQLCFEHPESLIPANVLSIDSIAGQLNSDNITLTYDLGQYSSEFKELSTATSEFIIIDGHQGKILLQDKKMALSVPSIAEKVSFSMLIEFKNSLEIEQGRKIFKSISFNL